MRGNEREQGLSPNLGCSAPMPAPRLQTHDPFGVGAILDARLDAAARAPVAVALSGGGDSLALLHLAAAWTSRVGRPLLALTVDHRLHPDSADWTARASAMAAEAGAEWRGLVWGGAKPRTGVPAAARVARHRLLAEAARAGGARVLLLAHTADDALENARMRAGDAPGMGRLREWAPSPVWPQGRGVALLRPLLSTAPRDVAGWLRARGLAWLDDPANADLRQPRIRVRQMKALEPPPRPPRDHIPLFVADAQGRAEASRAALLATPPDVARTQLAAALACVGGREAAVRGRTAPRLLDEFASAARCAATRAGPWSRRRTTASGSRASRPAAARRRRPTPPGPPPASTSPSAGRRRRLSWRRRPGTGRSCRPWW